MIQPWIPYPLTVQNSPENRSPFALVQCVKQFDVVANPRYTPRDLNGDGYRDTFCNIFLWDVTRALKCEIPHWVSPEGGVAPVGKGVELNANGVVKWMHDHGRDYGWTSAVEAEARMYARYGKPVVVLWANHSGIGHVAVMMPSPEDSPNVTYIAQSGKTNFENGPLKQGFGNIKPEFWFHE